MRLYRPDEQSTRGLDVRILWLEADLKAVLSDV